MFKLVWIPKKFKHFSYRELAQYAHHLAEEAQKGLEETRKINDDVNAQLKRLVKLEVDYVVRLNSVASLTQEEALERLKEIIPFLEETYPSLKEGDNDDI